MSLLAQPGPNGAEFVYEEPPEYAQVVTRAHPIQTEHAYQLSKRSKYRLSLALTSRARDAREQPHFVQRDEIMGSVELTLNHEEVIRSVTISVCIPLVSRLTVPLFPPRFQSVILQLQMPDRSRVGHRRPFLADRGHTLSLHCAAIACLRCQRGVAFVNTLTSHSVR